MPALEPHDRIIRSLTDDLRPVQRVPNPVLRSCTWLLGVAGLAVVLYYTSHYLQLTRGQSVSPYIWAATVGSGGTAILAALATFELILPDRKVHWAFLPVPAFALWILSSGLGCLGNLFATDSWGQSFEEAGQCFLFIAGIAVPLAILLFTMLRRTYTLRPTLVAIMAGLSVAAASATLLTLIHPHSSALLDLVAHTVGIGFVLITSMLAGGSLLRRKLFARM